MAKVVVVWCDTAPTLAILREETSKAMPIKGLIQ